MQFFVSGIEFISLHNIYGYTTGMKMTGKMSVFGYCFIYRHRSCGLKSAKLKGSINDHPRDDIL